MTGELIRVFDGDVEFSNLSLTVIAIGTGAVVNAVFTDPEGTVIIAGSSFVPDWKYRMVEAMTIGTELVKKLRADLESTVPPDVDHLCKKSWKGTKHRHECARTKGHAIVIDGERRVDHVCGCGAVP